MPICIYPQTCVDFSTNGLGLLTPTSCIAYAEDGHYSELELIQPIDDTYRWAQLQRGCIIKAPVPARESPFYENAENITEGKNVTVERQIYRVRVRTHLRLRSGPGTSYKILGAYGNNTQVIRLDTSGSWYKVALVNGGKTGWMHSGYLSYYKTATEVVNQQKVVGQRVIQYRQAEDQLWRIYRVEPDTEKGIVTAKAQHIFYDLQHNMVNEEYEPENEPAGTILAEIWNKLMEPPEHELHIAGGVDQKIDAGTYSFKNPVECMLDPESGILSKTNAQLVLDNYDIWVLPNIVRDSGVTIRRKKNLKGVKVQDDDSGVVTRILPRGKDKDGNPLYITNGTGPKKQCVDSPRIGAYPTPRPRMIDYDVRVVDKEPDGEKTFKTEAQARAKLTELAQAEFDENGADLPAYGMTVNFVLLQNTAGNENYAALNAVFLGDTVTVNDNMIQLQGKVRVTGFKFNCLTKRYIEITLGEIDNLEQTVYNNNLPTGGISGSKIAMGSADGGILRNLSVQYAKIAVAAIEQLSANAITAIRADIHEIVAGSVTADQLYADLAILAATQITAANIDKANIDWAAIESLNAQIAKVSKAHIADADIEWAKIDTLNTAIGEIAEAKIKNAKITTAQIDNLSTVITDAIHLEAKTGNFALAEVKNLLSSALLLQEGYADSMMIVNLAVTSANLLNATVDKLVVKATDGKYYHIQINSDGAISTEEVTVTDGEIAAGETSEGRQIVATTANVDSLNASTVKAAQAILGTIFAESLTAGKITAGEALIASATIPALYVTSIEAIGNSLTFSANERIQAIVTNAQATQEQLDNLQVGGRNLYTGTRDFSGEDWLNLKYWTADGTYEGLTVMTNSYAWYGLCQKLELDVGAYTFSAWARCDAAASIALYTLPNGAPSGSAEFDVSEWSLGNIGQTWTRISATFNVTAAGTAWVRLENTNASSFWLCGLKLERGNKATDWTPAPEDVNAKIDTLETSVTQTADQITLLVERTESIEGSLDTAGSTAETALGMAEILDGKLTETQAAAQTAQNTADEVVRLSQSLQTQITQTAGGLDIVRTQTSDLEGRVETIESGVHIEGATIGIYASGSPFRNVITNSGWTITENDSPVITCAETKLTAPRVQITDAMMIGGLAWKPGSDKHLRLLKYGR